MTEEPDYKQIHLSPPDVSDTEIESVVRALRSGWVAPVGPDVDAFEREMASFCGVEHGVALSSGTASLHLGLNCLGVREGDEVVVPTMTFAATAFAVHYLGARPVFIDMDPDSWTLDAGMLEDFLLKRQRQGRLPAAVITVDLLGRTCDYLSIEAIAGKFNIPILSDSAEALGATCGERMAGSVGEASVLSFNGNKIMTTSGGGMLLTNRPDIASRTRYLASQARQPVAWYEHQDIGFNYRMSNILAALGRAQLQRLPAMIKRRRDLQDAYVAAFTGMPGVRVLPDPPWGRSSGWLTTVQFDRALYPNAPTRVVQFMADRNIECRRVWKPMHQQPVFAGSEFVLGGRADRAFDEGVCLPSGSALLPSDAIRIAALVVESLRCDV